MRRVSDAHRAVVRRGFQPVSKRLADARVHQGDVWQVNGVARFVAATVGHDPAVLGVDDSAPVGGTAADGPRLGEDPPRVESGLAEKIRRGAEFGRGVGLGGCGHDCSSGSRTSTYPLVRALPAGVVGLWWSALRGIAPRRHVRRYMTSARPGPTLVTRRRRGGLMRGSAWR